MDSVKMHGQQAARIERQRDFSGLIVSKSIARKAAVAEMEAFQLGAAAGLSGRMVKEYLTDLTLSGVLVRIRAGESWAYWDARTMPEAEAKVASIERLTESL